MVEFESFAHFTGCPGGRADIADVVVLARFVCRRGARAFVEGPQGEKIRLAGSHDRGRKRNRQRRPCGAAGVDGIDAEIINAADSKVGHVGGEIARCQGAEVDLVVPLGIVELVHGGVLAGVLVTPENLDCGVFAPGGGDVALEGLHRADGCGVTFSQLRGREAGKCVEGLGGGPSQGSVAALVAGGETIVVLLADEQPESATAEGVGVFVSADLDGFFPSQGVVPGVDKAVIGPNVDHGVASGAGDGARHVGSVQTDFGSVVRGDRGSRGYLDLGLPCAG